MIASLSVAVARSVERRRGTWVVVALALCAIGLWGSSRLSFRLDIGDFLPPQSTDTTGLPPDVQRELSGGGHFAVVVESGDSIATGDVERLFGFLTPRLAALPGVRTVDARVTAELTRFAEEQLPARIALYLEPGVLAAAGDRLSRAAIEVALLTDEQALSGLPRTPAERERDPLGVLRLVARGVRGWQGVSRVRLIDGYYALPGARAFFLTVETTTALDDIGAARAMVAAVNGVLAAARDDAEVGPILAERQLFPVGRAVSFVAAVAILSADAVRVTLAAVIAVLVLLAVFFRRATAPVVILLTVGAGTALTGAGAWLLFGSVSLFTWVFVGLLVGLGVDYGVHIVVHYWVYGETKTGRTEALASAIARPGAGIALGAVTSAVAFLSLVTSPYPWMTELAVLTALGLVTILVCSFTLLPLLLSFWSPAAPSTAPWLRWGTWFERAGRGPRLPAAIPWIVLVVASLIALPGLRFEPHPWKLALRGNPESARLDRLNREAGSAFTPLLIVSSGATADQALARDREAVRRLRPLALQAGVASIQSLARWLPDPEAQQANIRYVGENRELFSPERLRRDFEAVVSDMDNPSPYLTEEYLPAILRSLDPQVAEVTLSGLRDLGLGAAIDRHLMEVGGVHVAVSYVFLRQFPWAEGAASTFLAVAQEAGLQDLPGVTLAGDALRSSAHALAIRRAALLATLVAAVLVGGLLVLRFRRVSLVILCLTPLLCGLSAALLTMRLFGIELTLLSIAIAPILVGIGVDDGIHIVDRLSAGQDLGTVIREAGAAITLTTLTTVGAFAALSLATFTGIRELGLVGSVGLIACLLASVHLIPLGWRLTEEGRRHSSVR